VCAQGIALKKIVKYATAKGFTDVAVFNEDRKQINGMLLIHLPAGPTALFRLSSLKLSKEIKVRIFLFSFRLPALPVCHHEMMCHTRPASDWFCIPWFCPGF
jgi:hypothetical protein